MSFFRNRQCACRRRIVKCLAATIIVLGGPVGAAAQTFTEFPIPTPESQPLGITAGPDGALWFTEGQAGTGNGKIGRITTSGVITEYPITSANSDPFGIAPGPNGTVWFTESAASKIGQITTGGVITEYPTQMTNRGPAGIALFGSALAFTEYADNIGIITTSGGIGEYPIPTASSNPLYITTGPDGNLWFTEHDANQIGRMNSSGVATEFPIPTPNSGPTGITAGPDGALWFVEYNANKIGRITIAGAVTEFPIAGRGIAPYGIIAGPDGALWFTDCCGSIVRITTTGISSAFKIPTAPSTARVPLGIAVGPDDALWFTDYVANKIGRLGLTTLTASPTFGSAPLPIAFSAVGILSTMSYIIAFGDGKNGQVAKRGCTPASPIGGDPRRLQCSRIASHTYANAGKYTATLLNSDNTALAWATITVSSPATEYNSLDRFGGAGHLSTSTFARRKIPVLRDVPGQTLDVAPSIPASPKSR